MELDAQLFHDVLVTFPMPHVGRYAEFFVEALNDVQALRSVRSADVGASLLPVLLAFQRCRHAEGLSSSGFIHNIFTWRCRLQLGGSFGVPMFLIRLEMRKWTKNRIEEILVSNSSLVSGLPEASRARFSSAEVSRKV